MLKVGDINKILVNRLNFGDNSTELVLACQNGLFIATLTENGKYDDESDSEEIEDKPTKRFGLFKLFNSQSFKGSPQKKNP